MASIGDLIFKLTADGSGLIKDVEFNAAKAGDKGAAAFSARFSKGLKQTIGLAAGAGFGLLAAQAAELDSATRQAAAAAGIAADEFGAFRSEVAGLTAANPSKSISEIAAAVGAVRTDLGLTGQAATDAAQAILDFSKVSGQDGAEAVRGLDDVLDAFNLDASRGTGIMDMLVASHAKYGGSISANVSALQRLAPQLQALNVDIDGGIALLNLFASTGLDASQATFALNTAVRNLKPGQDLDDLIAQIAAIEDPTLRAQEAIKVFGARGGVALANALRPGIDGLDDFKVTAEEAAGATTKAADVVDDSFRNRVVGAIRSVLGPLSEIGPDAPAILSAVAGLGVVATAIRGIGSAFDFAAARAAAGWVAILGPAALLEAAKPAINDALTGLLGIGESWGRVQAAMQGGTAATQAGTDALASQAETSDEASYALQQLGLAGASAEEQQAAMTATGEALRDAIRRLTGATEDATATTETGTAAVAHATDNTEKYVHWVRTADGWIRTSEDSIVSQAGAMRNAARDADRLADSYNTAASAARNLAQASISERLAAQGDDPGDTSRAQSNLDFVREQAEREAAAERERQRIADEARRKRETAERSATAASNRATRDREQALAKEQRRLEDLADTYRNRLGGAFDKVRDLALRAFDRIHEANRRAIEDARDLAREQNDARLTEAEKAQDQIERNRRLRDLNEELADAARELAAAQTPEDRVDASRRLRDAREAIQSFRAEENIANIRAEVEAANAQVDAEAERALDAEDARFERERKLFEGRLAALEKNLADVKGAHADAHADLLALFDQFGLDYETAGKNLSKSFADGLAKGAKDVAKFAAALAKTVADYLKVSSPARVGPLHETSPEQMGRRIVANLAKGLGRAIPGFEAQVAALAGAMSLSAPSLALPNVAAPNLRPMLAPAAAAIAPAAAPGAAPPGWSYALVKVERTDGGLVRWMDERMSEL